MEPLLADYATNVCGHPVRRHDTHGHRPSVIWSIDGDPMVELLIAPDGPDRLLVHDVALLAPIRKTLRTRHLVIEYAGAG